MTREEQILDAARKYVYGVTLSSPSDVLHFENGAKWADKHPINVWREAKAEVPRLKVWILVEYDCDNSGSYFGAIYTDIFGEKDWKSLYQSNSIIRWAYIEDLLPKTFGNPEQLKGGE